MFDPTIIGPYVVLDLLGEGGAGSVYLARRDEASRPVALKAVHVAQEASRNDQDQVKREIMAMERLSHPNIVKLWDAGYDGEWLYYAMEYCEAGPLDRFLEENGRPSHIKTLEMSLGLTRGVGYLHQMGVVHRDLKPSNALFTKEQVPKLSDFGVAKLPEDGKDPQGVRIGSPRYMAPEVRDGGEATCASDVFQLGLLLYRLIAGLELHKAHKTSGFTKGVTGSNFLAPSRFNNQSTLELDDLVLSCLHPDPGKRPRATDQMIQTLESILGEC